MKTRKQLEKEGRGSMDYRLDGNFNRTSSNGLIIDWWS